MKKILFLLILLTPFFGWTQIKNQTVLIDKWKEIERLIAIKNYEQTKSYLVDIKAAAKRNGDQTNWIRAILAESHITRMNTTADSGFVRSKRHFQQAIKESEGTSKAVLNNFYAMFLWSNANRYLSKTDDPFINANGDKKFAIIDSIFSQSIQSKKELLSLDTKNWTTIFSEVNNLSLSPTLYHIMVYHYLDFLKQASTKKEARIKELQNDLLAINKENKYDDATVYLLTREIPVYSYRGQNENFIAQFEEIIKRHKSNYNAFLLYQIANSFVGNDNRKAISYINRAKEDYPNSPWISNISRLEKQVKKADLTIFHTANTPSKEYISIQLTARNVDSIYIRVFNTTNTPKQYKNYPVKYDSTSFVTSVDALMVYEEKKALKDFADYNTHSTIYKLNPLPYGNYKILYSNNADFKNDGESRIVTSSSVTVSDVFITFTKDKETDKYDEVKALLIDRKSGKPYANESVQFYSINSKTNETKPSKSFKTNSKGEFIHKFSNDDIDDFELFIAKENQLIDLSEIDDVPEHLYEKDDEDNSDNNFQSMLDRAIYRPGQTVYFKSILYNNHRTLGKTIPNQKVEVTLYDANSQKIDSIFLNTNDFGSVNGSFKLPSNTLAGNFRIHFEASDVYATSATHFRVEEYKRPTFKVEFETNIETYTLKDTAIFVGRVESLAGAKISDASVKYKVEFYNNRTYKTTTYLDSTMTTDEEGKFKIRIPLMDTTFRDLSNFRLQYQAEVTNQSGEMQQASGSYYYTNKPWNISIQSPRNVAEGKWSKLHINTTNQNGQSLKFAGQVNIYKVEDIQKPITNNYKDYFKNTEYHLLNNGEYENYFPNYFDAATLIKDNKRLIKTYAFDTRDTSLVLIDSTLFSKGTYLVEAISIQENDTIRSQTNTYIYDPVTRKIAENQFFAYSLDRNSYSIGDKVTATFYTDVKNAANLFLIENIGSKKGETKVLNFKNGIATSSFTLTKDMISPNIELNALFIKNNQLASHKIFIPVTQADKNINIKIGTFRDKITPGQKEKWSFTISNKDKKIAAEVLATMYDSSLDVFASNSFSSSFPLESDYYYDRLDFYYLQYAFNQSVNSRTNFNKNLLQPDKSNNLSAVRAYGLWNKDVEGFATGSTRGVELRSVSSLNSSDAVLNEVVVRGSSSPMPTIPLYVIDGEIADQTTYEGLSKDEIHNIEVLKDAAATALYGSRGANGVIIITTKKNAEDDALNKVQARTNLQETAFFYPALYTDADGNVSFEFDSPEALTKWKLLLFAHGKNLEAGSTTLFTQTQKQLMVRPNLPRYVREGDQITIKAQIQNLSKEVQKGSAKIEIINPENNEVISSKFIAESTTQSFEAQASKNTLVEWKLTIPKDYPSINIKIVAASNEFSDGEIQEIPVLPNSVLVSETEKIVLKAGESVEHTFKASQKDNLQARIQVQSNPILEIISAIDYLKNYPYECSEQLTSKWFGLKMVEYIGKHYPAISTYFKSLNSKDAQGRLEENSSLNELKMEEMPWLRDIEGEESKLKAIAALFNSNIQNDIKAIEQKLAKNQLNSGGFPWFEGGKESNYISTRILEILGKVLYLDKALINPNMRGIAQKLTKYLDQDTTMFSARARYDEPLDYLYARQYWTAYFPVDSAKINKLKPILAKSSLMTANRSAGFAAKSWITNQIFGIGQTSNEIKNRLTQEAITDENKGMYWESNRSYYNSTSLQSYMVEAYKLHDPSKLQALTQWIYYSKQANHWHTTWMTVDAIYALLLANNPQDFAMENTVKVYVDQNAVEANKTVLGQFTKSFNKDELTADKQIKIENNNSRTVYGNLVHQYFVALQDVKSNTRDISIQKQYLVERNGQWYVTKEAKLGERIKVKITVINDNNLQYVHLKDARPSGVEPIYQPSGYKWWQGYYFTMKDASTNYFFDNLGKGKREFEYEVKANNVGIFNSGVTSIECMYDPSVNARSENISIKIKE